MEAVVKVGEVLGAERLIRIVNAHISGISYRNIGDEGLEFLKSLAEKGARFSVPTTVNPAGMDLSKWKEMGVTEEFAIKQLEILDALRFMGAKLALTCTPYRYIKIRFGDHLAWSESSAVLYANSILGARTNRDGGPLALFEGLVGSAPLVGMHLSESRVPTVVYDLSNLRSECNMVSELGYFIGRAEKRGVPAIINLPKNFSEIKNLKLFLASIGTSSGIAMVLIQGISPEFKEDYLKGLNVVKPMKSDLVEIRESFFAKDGVVVLGCPHLSPEEIAELANKLKDSRVTKRMILFTSRAAAKLARNQIKLLQERGVDVFFDTCMVVTDLKNMGIKDVVVDSAKAAYYLQSQGYNVNLMSREEALEYACEGN